jgi:hypothetical protein
VIKKKYSKYIITDVTMTDAQKQEDIRIQYAKWATRINNVKEDITGGAYHVGCAWYLKVPPDQLAAHTHEYDKLLGFYGSNPEKPHELGGEIEFILGDEQYILNKSFLIFVPRGVEHSMTIRKVDKPIFTFGVIHNPNAEKQVNEGIM